MTDLLRRNGLKGGQNARTWCPNGNCCTFETRNIWETNFRLQNVICLNHFSTLSINFRQNVNNTWNCNYSQSVKRLIRVGESEVTKPGLGKGQFRFLLVWVMTSQVDAVGSPYPMEIVNQLHIRVRNICSHMQCKRG